MAENIIVNGVTYNGVDSVTMKNTNGDNIPFAPNTKTYNLTLAKASGWILLTELDEEVVSHINDAALVVTLVNTSEYAYEFYAGSTFVASNTPWGINGAYPCYGIACRVQSETKVSYNAIFYPANNTDTNYSLGGLGSFRIDGNKYYFRPYDGFIRPGEYRLTFTW